MKVRPDRSQSVDVFSKMIEKYDYGRPELKLTHATHGEKFKTKIQSNKTFWRNMDSFDPLTLLNTH